MTRKRYIKLLMGRDRFNRNEARLLAESVQVMQRFADRVNHIAKSSGKQYRETWRGYAWNWNHRDEAETGIIVKYYGKAYCHHCRKVVPHGLQDKEHTYSTGRLFLELRQLYRRYRIYDLRNGYRIPEIVKLGENQCR